MKKSDKILVFVLIFVFILCCVGIFSIVLKKDIVIESYAATIDIDEYGNILVSEKIEIDYRKEYNERWRDIIVEKKHSQNPLYDDIDRTLYSGDIPTFEKGEVLSVLKDGTDITNKVRIGYSFNNDLDAYGDPITVAKGRGESLYVDATNAGGLDGLMTFEYQYQLNGMVTCYEDIAELNYVLFEYMEGTIKNVAIEINLIKDTSEMDEDLFYSYGHGVSNGEIIQAINNKPNKAQADYQITAKNVKNDEKMEFRLLFPKEVVESIDESHVVNVPMKNKIITYERELYIATRNQNIAGITINVITVLALGLTVLFVVLAYKKYDKEYEAKFTGQYYRELPNVTRTPAEMSYLYYFGKTNDEDVTATLLDLIRRKVLILDVGAESVNTSNPNFMIYLNRESTELSTLKNHERKLINWFIGIIGDKEKVSFREIEKYGSASYSNAQNFQRQGMEFKKAVKETCKNHNYFEKFSINGKHKAMFKVIYIVLMLGASLLISMMFNVDMNVNFVIFLVMILGYIIYVGSIKKRSIEGNEEYAKWKAFKNFLEDFSSFEDYPIPGVVVWEEYLVYATSFKIADKVMEQLEVKLPDYDEQEVTYMRRSYYGYSYHPYLYVRSFNNTMTTARRNTISTINAHASRSGGSGRGGGFTGGSSFGGGGGGGRSR